MPLTWFAFMLDKSLFHPGAPAIFNVLSIGAQLALVWGVFTWARKRIDDWFAAAGALLILTYGAGSEVLTWSFNFGWIIALAAGIWALIVYEREPDTRRNRLLTIALLLVSLSGDNLVVIFCVAIGAQVLFRETRWKAISVIALPLALWVLWDLKYGGGSQGALQPSIWPYMVAKQLESAFDGWVFAMVGWGAPLMVLGIGVIAARLWKLEKITPTLVTALALPITFMALIAITRSNTDPAVSRYMYTLAVFLTLLFAEVLRGGLRMERAGQLIAFLAIVGFLAIGNTNWMVTTSASWRNNVTANKEYFTAISIAGRDATCKTKFDPPDVLMVPQLNCLLYDKMVVKGGQAYSAAELAEKPADAQKRVSSMVELIRKMQ
jgi:hypothetical protein